MHGDLVVDSLLVLAAACFVLVAMRFDRPPLNFLGVGLFLWVLAILLINAKLV